MTYAYLGVGLTLLYGTIRASLPPIRERIWRLTRFSLLVITAWCLAGAIPGNASNPIFLIVFGGLAIINFILMALNYRAVVTAPPGRIP